MIEAIIWALLALGGLVTILWALNVARNAGRDQERSEGLTKAVERRRDANRVEDAVRRDPDKRDGVLDKYYRD